MDFEPDFIAEDKYWAFGLFAKKDGTIDYKELKDALEQIQYFIAAISLQTADGIFFARLCQSCGYKWIFEDPDDPKKDISEHFQDFVDGSVFQKFAEQAQTIIQKGFDSLEKILNTDPDDLRKNGIKVNEIENIVSMSNSIIKKVSAAFEHPVLKK